MAEKLIARIRCNETSKTYKRYCFILDIYNLLRCCDNEYETEEAYIRIKDIYNKSTLKRGRRFTGDVKILLQTVLSVNHSWKILRFFLDKSFLGDPSRTVSIIYSLRFEAWCFFGGKLIEGNPANYFMHAISCMCHERLSCIHQLFPFRAVNILEFFVLVYKYNYLLDWNDYKEYFKLLLTTCEINNFYSLLDADEDDCFSKSLLHFALTLDVEVDFLEFIMDNCESLTLDVRNDIIYYTRSISCLDYIVNRFGFYIPDDFLKHCIQTFQSIEFINHAVHHYGVNWLRYTSVQFQDIDTTGSILDRPIFKNVDIMRPYQTDTISHPQHPDMIFFF